MAQSFERVLNIDNEPLRQDYAEVVTFDYIVMADFTVAQASCNKAVVMAVGEPTINVTTVGTAAR